MRSSSTRALMVLVFSSLLVASAWIGGCSTGTETDVPAASPQDTTGNTDAPPGEGDDTPEGDFLIETRCTRCHSRVQIDSVEKDRAGWESTVDRMIQSGADLTEGEKQIIIDYLLSQ